MSWFKKSEGDDLMLSSNNGGRAGAPEASVSRP
jgi:hypothetical protein